MQNMGYGQSSLSIGTLLLFRRKPHIVGILGIVSLNNLEILK